MAERKTAKRRGPTTVILFNKPFNVLSQFTDDKPDSPAQSRQVLADFIDIPDVYPCGRLDRDSEGLLVLTNNGKLQAQISNPASKLEKSYLAQVEGDVDEQALQRLRNGITLKDGRAQASGVLKTVEPAWLWPRTPPIRKRQSIPTSWLQLSLTEGRNRQVRRMTAHIGFPTLRLVRVSVGEWTLGNLRPGEWRSTSPASD